MDPQCSGKSAALLSEFGRRLLPLLHQHLDMTVKKKRRTVFSVQEGKTHPSAPNASFSAPVCNDAPNNSGSVFFFPPPAERHPQNADKTSDRAATACLARFCLPRELWRHRRTRRSLRPCDASRAPLSSARSASPGGQWLCRYAVAPLPRTASSASSSTCAFSKARRALCRPCSRPQNAPVPQTQALLPLRASVRCRKNREGFSESGRGPPSTNVFRRCGGTPHVGRSPAPWKMFFRMRRTDRSSNAV